MHKLVVSQRDFWEDHLRLMEGLMSGALVMSDPITHLPAGLKENESIVIYNSLEELEQKILYYLRMVRAPKIDCVLAKLVGW